MNYCTPSTGFMHFCVSFWGEGVGKTIPCLVQIRHMDQSYNGSLKETVLMYYMNMRLTGAFYITYNRTCLSCENMFNIT